jgi:hypothetical protein
VTASRRGPRLNVVDEWAAPAAPSAAQPAAVRVPPLRRRYPRRATTAGYRPVQLRRPRPAPNPPLAFGSVATWATEFLFPSYARDVRRAGYTWCPRWWAHAEAIGRLDALWRAWEHHRQNPALGMALWWRDLADPTMATLFHPAGPFAACTATRHHDRDRIPPLPAEPAPTALFPDVRTNREPRQEGLGRARI